MVDRIPPNDEAAERAVLGCAFLDQQRSLPPMRRMVSPEDFYNPARGQVWRAICALADAGATIDPLLIKAYLERVGTWKKVGTENLTGLTDAVGSTVNAEEYARRVRDLAALRRTIYAMSEATARCYEVADEPTALMAEARSAVTKVAAVDDGGLGVVSASQGMADAYDHVTTPDDQATYLPGGINGLKIQRGVPTIIGGRTSNGKSTAALCVAANVAEQGHSVLYFSLEDTTRVQFVRLGCRYAKVDLEKAMEKQLAGDDYPRYLAAVEHASKLPIAVVSRAGVTGEWIHQTAALYQQEHGLDLVIVDYAQLVHGRGDSETERVMTATRDLVTMARELNVGFILVSQINRPEKGKIPGPPTIYDLKQSGELENAARCIILLHYRYHYTKDPEDRHRLLWDVAKKTNGQTTRLDAYAGFAHSYIGSEDELRARTESSSQEGY